MGIYKQRCNVRITSYNVCYTKLLRDSIVSAALESAAEELSLPSELLSDSEVASLLFIPLS